MEYNYTAIVLKKRKIGETDRLYTFYTLEAGKIQAIGKGIRKPEAKLAGHLETLSQSDIIVARARGLGNVASALTERYYLALKSDPDMLWEALEAIVFFERLVDLEEQDTELFLRLQEYVSLAEVEATQARGPAVRLLTVAFLLQLLSYLGYHVETKVCAFSGLSLRGSIKYYFSPDIGGVIRGEYAAEAKRATAVGESTVKLLRLILNNRLAALLKLQVDEGTLNESRKALRLLLQWVVR